MKNTPRIRRNGSTAAAPSQAKTKSPAMPAESKVVRMRADQVERPKTEPPPEVLIPSQVVEEVESAMNKLYHVGNAAVAFVMMTAYEIKNCSKNDSGWQEFEAPGFSSGAQDLARLVSTDFNKVALELDDVCLRAMQKIRGINAPIVKRERAGGFFKAFDAIDPKRAWYRIENVTRSLAHCIDLQAWALSHNGSANPQAGSFQIQKQLQEAYEVAEKSVLDLMEVFCSVAEASARQELVIPKAA